MNHYPVIGRKVPASCDDANGTANPFASIDCPRCRGRLQIKVTEHEKEALRHKDGSQEREFFSADAKHYARVLAQ